MWELIGHDVVITPGALQAFDAYDEAWDKDTIIIKYPSGKYRILGQDRELYEIDPCTAMYYIIRYRERYAD